MKNIKNMKVYFASPWFTPEQEEREDRVKNKLRSLGFNVWSPKDNCACSPIADEETRKRVFNANVKNIMNCDIIFAITDGKDMGTIWEAGFACGINKLKKFMNAEQIKIVYYCETLGPNGQFNLMLAQSGDIVITEYEDLNKLPRLIEKDKGLTYNGIIE